MTFEPPTGRPLAIERLDLRRSPPPTELRRDVRAIVESSYADADAQIDPAWERSSNLYTARDERGSLAGFFFVAREQATVAGINVPTLYLGQSAIAQSWRGHGVVTSLLRAAAKDVMQWQSELGREVIVWAKTATPVILRALRKAFVGVEPGPDGEISAAGRAVSAMARAFYGLPTTTPDGEHPFVLRAVSRGRYSRSEAARVSEASANAPGGWFARLALDEANGDRLLVVCRVAL